LLSSEECEPFFREASRASREVLNSRRASDTTLHFRRPRDPTRVFRTAVCAAFAVGSGVDEFQNHIRAGAGQPLDAPARARLLRCIIRGPFPPSKCEPPAHLVQWAHGIYDERAFDEMPFFADALDEAGCAEQALLDHLRAGGPHFRGCWAIDRLTARE
jgi:hypothetical protein